MFEQFGVFEMDFFFNLTSVFRVSSSSVLLRRYICLLMVPIVLRLNS